MRRLASAFAACIHKVAGPQIRVRDLKLYFFSSTKTHVVGTQKNRLNETVLLSTQNTRFNDGKVKKCNFTPKKHCLMVLCVCMLIKTQMKYYRSIA